MRIIGLDLGEKRIGVAAADDRTQVAVPVTTISAGSDAVAAITKLVEEQQADEVVVGLPLSMTGAIGPQARLTIEVVGRAPEGARDAIAAAIVLQAYLDAHRRSACA